MYDLSRRHLLKTGTAGVALATVSATPWSLALADPTTIQNQLAPIATSNDFVIVRQLLAAMLSDPAVRTLASSVLQNDAAQLTPFQSSLLGALLTATQDPGVINVIINGQAPTPRQRALIGQINGQLSSNAAIQVIRTTGAKLKGAQQTNLLTSYVSTAIGNDILPLGTISTLGDPNLDAIVQDFANLRNSTLFANIISSVVPILQDPDFITFLHNQPPEILAAFIPADVLIALKLPGDASNPALTGFLEIVGGFALILAAGILGIPLLAGLEGLALIGAAIGLLLIALGGCASIFAGVLNLFKQIDCDRDGDPNDPNDVSGGECH
jgi:hypothetical protein